MNSFANSFGLETDDMNEIISILAAHPEVETAVLYGSRATGRFRYGSDIDLALTGKRLTNQIVLDMHVEFDDSDVPFMVDVVAKNEIKDENLKREIDGTGKVFYMQIPTEQDWANPYDDLDIITAKKSFFGKNLEEAEELFVKNALCYQEDIMWMPSVPFQYYVHAYMNYLLGRQSEQDTDAASSFLSLVEFKAGGYNAPVRVGTVDAFVSFVKSLCSSWFHSPQRAQRDHEAHNENHDDLRAVWSRVKETIEHIRNNPEWFDWNESIYGNLEERTLRLLAWEEPEANAPPLMRSSLTPTTSDPASDT